MAEALIDTTSRYRPVVVAIHWISAALILTQIWLGFEFGDYPRGSPEQTQLFSWHKTVGVVILLLALLRLAVRIGNPPPPFPGEMAHWEKTAAIWTHRLFYFFLIALPLTGLAAVSRGGPTTMLVGGIPFPTVPLPIGEIHEPLAFGMIGLLVLHVGGALKHQFIDRGPQANRMWPFRATR